MKLIKKFVFFLSLTVLASLISCKSTKTESGETTIFTTDWIESSYSDTDKLGHFFTTPEIGQFSMIEGEFKKSGGYEHSAFGFVFGYTADEKGWLSDYMRFEITTAGNYAAFACKGNTYIDLVEANDKNTAYMNESSAINSGYDSVNKLKIQKIDDKKYDLFINGTKVTTITVPDGFGNSDGVMAFFSVGTKNQEQFPSNPVKVTYRITDSLN